MKRAPRSIAWRAYCLAAIGAILIADSIGARAAEPCGERIDIATHGTTTTRYSIARPKDNKANAAPVALVLLAGGGGYLNLDERGCPRALAGNSLIRSVPLFLDLGFIAVRVDSPSDHTGTDGLAGFRMTASHAKDLGKIIADVRARTKAEIWVVGTSRGSLSAANAATRLSGPDGPNGVVLTSALTMGQAGARRSWVADTVFDLELESIRIPLLVVGHENDSCIRTPAHLMSRIAERTNSPRRQVVTVAGGAGSAGISGVDACEAHSPHGFLGQEEEVAAGIARFIRDGRY
ncbi:MAG: hypothetical protein ACKVSF_14510 [Alphaproteobacteria bacterium]